MDRLIYTLVGDGPSDRRLMSIIDWTLGQLTNCPFTGQWADTRVLPPARDGLTARLRTALEYFPCDLLFVHRDAEGADPAQRRVEIEDAVSELDVPPYVPIIPVRMQEAWLLIDEQAIRTAAGNPRGRVPLTLPRPGTLEGIADPKELLHRLLREASELGGRRLRSFDPGRQAHRVAELIADFTPLRLTTAYPLFKAGLLVALESNGWTTCE